MPLIRLSASFAFHQDTRPVAGIDWPSAGRRESGEPPTTPVHHLCTIERPGISASSNDETPAVAGVSNRAGEENRTLVCSLGSCRSTIELHPQNRFATVVTLASFCHSGGAKQRALCDGVGDD